jgi:hypothetical protein
MKKEGEPMSMDVDEESPMMLWVSEEAEMS